MRVTCSFEECDVEDEHEKGVPGVCATCSRCGHEATALGTGEKSIKRALATLRGECPESEENFYVDDDGGGESRMPEPVVRPWWKK